MRQSLWAVLSALLLTCAVNAAEPAPSIRFPTTKSPVAPTPAPQPVSKLTTGRYYVIDSDVELFVTPVSQQGGSLNEKVFAGPKSFFAKFAGGGPDEEEKEFKGKFLYVYTASSDGPVTLVVIPKGETDKSKIIVETLMVETGKGPQPPPDDGKANPTPATGPVYIAVVRDPGKVTPAQAAVLGDTATWDSFKADGSDWDFYSNASKTAIDKNYVELAQSVQTGGDFAPSVLVLDKKTGKKLDVFRLPESSAALKAAVTAAKTKGVK